MKSLNTIITSIIAAFLLLSCNNNDHDIQSIEPKKIDSVQYELDTMTLHTMQPIKVFSSYVAGCEGFYGMDYITKDSIRNVINYAVKTNEGCLAVSYPMANLIRFEPKTKGTFYFKFFNGKNASGENTWIEKQIVVK